MLRAGKGSCKLFLRKLKHYSIIAESMSSYGNIPPRANPISLGQKCQLEIGPNCFARGFLLFAAKGDEFHGEVNEDVRLPS